MIHVQTPTHALRLDNITVKEGNYDEVWDYLEKKSKRLQIGILHLLTFHGYELKDLSAEKKLTEPRAQY